MKFIYKKDKSLVIKTTGVNQIEEEVVLDKIAKYAMEQMANRGI